VQIKGREQEYDRAKALIEPYVDQHYPLRLYGQKNFTAKGELVPFASGRKLESMLPCWLLFTEPHISFDGYMSACFCDHDKCLYMGDLKKMSVLEAWHSEPFVALRQKHLASDVTSSACASCLAYLQ
jgi:hypothetical protein